MTRSDVERVHKALLEIYGVAQLRLSATLRHRNFHKFMAVEQICESSPAEDLPTAARIQRLPSVLKKAEEL